jgi:hypothetical protein
MRRSKKKLVAGAAVGALPFLLAQSPASAATASDSDAATVVYTPTSGDRIPCSLNANHDIDTGSGNLDVTFDSTCTGTLSITVRYVDTNDEAVTMSTSAHHSDFQSISLHKVGRTAVTLQRHPADVHQGGPSSGGRPDTGPGRAPPTLRRPRVRR